MRLQTQVLAVLLGLSSFVLNLGCMKTGASAEIKDTSKQSPSGPQKPQPVERVLLLGDSLSVSMGATSTSSTLAVCLEKITGLKSLNRAQAGATTYEILQQLKATQTEEASVIFLSAGGNDVLEDLQGQGFSEEETMKNFATILTELKGRKARLVYLALNPPYGKAQRLVRMGRMAETEGLVVVDGMKDLWGNKDLMADQIHPNDEGYKKICERLTTALQK